MLPRRQLNALYRRLEIQREHLGLCRRRLAIRSMEGVEWSDDTPAEEDASADAR